MASIRKEVLIDAGAGEVWDALRDVGALHTRLVPGFVTDVQLEGPPGAPTARTVTFANGMVARELIVAIDEQARRLVWSIVGGRFTHHNASAQVFDEGEGRCRFVWIADLLPDELAAAIAPMMEQGIQTIRKNFSGAASSPVHQRRIRFAPE